MHGIKELQLPEKSNDQGHVRREISRQSIVAAIVNFLTSGPSLETSNLSFDFLVN